MRFIYIHGFASSPHSRKAEAFRNGLDRHDVALEIPEMDAGDFCNLTITGQLDVLEGILRNEAAILIGSSMGGYVAALYASIHSEVEKLVLLAPAFNFATRWQAVIAGKHGTGEIPEAFEVFHYGEKRMRNVRYELIGDALQFPPFPDFAQPARIFHGRRDDVVPIKESRAFAAGHPNAVLSELDSDHELVDVLDMIVDVAIPFLRSTCH